MVDLMLDLAAHPEVAFEEVRSSRAIVEVLRKHGIEAELGAHGVETAIRAEIRAVEQGRMDKADNPLKNAPHTAAELLGEASESLSAG